jgi:thioredoxin reductase (NADPH)
VKPATLRHTFIGLTTTPLSRPCARVVRLSTGEEVRAFAVLVAPGSTYRRLGVPGEDDFIGAGVHFCATCDGPFYRGRDVLVVGGGNSATEAAIFLTKFVSHVTIVTRDARLTASQLAQQKVLEHPDIEHPDIDIRYRSTVQEFRGDGKLRSVILRNLTTDLPKRSIRRRRSCSSDSSPTRASLAGASS